MRVYMQMLEAHGHAEGLQLDQMTKDQTLELNAAHPIVVNLN